MAALSSRMVESKVVFFLFFNFSALAWLQLGDWRHYLSQLAPSASGIVCAKKFKITGRNSVLTESVHGTCLPPGTTAIHGGHYRSGLMITHE